MKITTYKHERVPVTDTELFIPTETFYCFQTGIRRSIRIVPKFVDWESDFHTIGDIYDLVVTCVYSSFECKIEQFTIQLNDIEHILNYSSEPLKKSIVEMLLNEDYYVRTKEQFESDLDKNIQSILNAEN